MKREELKAMGLTDEQVESVMAKNGAEVAALNTQITTLQSEKSQLENDKKVITKEKEDKEKAIADLQKNSISKDEYDKKIKEIEDNAKKENERKKKLAELEEAQKLAADLKGKEVNIEAKAGDGGRLFGAITNKDIAEAINSKFNLSIDKKKVVVGTIKVAGGYDVEVKLYPEVSTKMKVVIVPKQ